MKVVKMTLARLATEGMTDELTELLLGPTSLTYADGDPAGAAKALKSFAKDHDVLIIKGGLLGSEFLSPERISVLADLPSREVMLATIARTMAAPMTQMAGLLAAPARNAANAFKQLLEKKEAEAPELPATSDEQDTDPTVDETPPASEEEPEEELEAQGSQLEADAAEDDPETEEPTEDE